ncbi:NADP-dependent phosphogluconate dehydrogenase, partial [Klebsiella pneumoniae]|nr:NADP-dependent phosphogluconate dehydrogenase [Klebsiella pneumoniae]
HSLLRAAGLTNAEAADAFESWNHGDLNSYLVEITSRVLRAKDPRNPDTDLLDVIRDEAGMKGTGTWTVQTALELGVDVSTISEA